MDEDILNGVKTDLLISEKEELIIKTVKPFGKYSGHVTLSGELVGEEVMIVKL